MGMRARNSTISDRAGGITTSGVGSNYIYIYISSLCGGCFRRNSNNSVEEWKSRKIHTEEFGIIANILKRDNSLIFHLFLLLLLQMWTYRSSHGKRYKRAQNAFPRIVKQALWWSTVSHCVRILAQIICIRLFLRAFTRYRALYVSYIHRHISMLEIVWSNNLCYSSAAIYLYTYIIIKE